MIFAIGYYYSHIACIIGNINEQLRIIHYVTDCMESYIIDCMYGADFQCLVVT